jgi:hypothetical protein
VPIIVIGFPVDVFRSYQDGRGASFTGAIGSFPRSIQIDPSARRRTT